PGSFPRLASPLLLLEEPLKLERPLSPFFLSVGTKDPLLEDSRRLKRALDGLGVENELFVAPGEVHGFDAMVWRPAARAKWKAAHAFLQKLRDRPTNRTETAPSAPHPERRP
ncbi:MAG TPA: hypothetical protein VF407_04800, partial [Polyangiaceae bacterium]